VEQLNEEAVYGAISTVIDPEVGFNLVELGLIYGVSIDGGNVKVTMTLSTRGCPLHQAMMEWVKEAVERLGYVDSCEVDVVWEPEWNIAMASDNVKKSLNC
jgi:metal-sulfur cluster biosynthetic enzyme